MQVIIFSVLGDSKEIQRCILCEYGAVGRERRHFHVGQLYDLVLTAALEYTGRILLILMKAMLITLMWGDNQPCVCIQCNPEVLEGRLRVFC